MKDSSDILQDRVSWTVFTPVGGQFYISRLLGCYGALAWRMAAVGGWPTTMHVGPAARHVRAVGQRQAIEAETGVATGGQTTHGAGAPEFQTKPQASSPETTFCRGGVPEVPHAHGGAFLGGALVGGGPSRRQRISHG